MEITCGHCANYKSFWCDFKRDSPDPDLVRNCEYYKAANNRNRLRDMTDQQLAHWLCRMETDARYYGPKGENVWLKWLQEKVE